MNKENEKLEYNRPDYWYRLIDRLNESERNIIDAKVFLANDGLIALEERCDVVTGQIYYTIIIRLDEDYILMHNVMSFQEATEIFYFINSRYDIRKVISAHTLMSLLKPSE